VARVQGPGAQKASAQLFQISDFEFRILEFSFSIRIPQSTFRNSGSPPGPMKESVPHHAEKHGLAPGPGKASKLWTLI
jgi:hypothetical protein